MICKVWFIRQLSIGLIAMLSWCMTANAYSPEPPNVSLINDFIIRDIRQHTNVDIVRLSIKNQNYRYKNISAQEIQALDKKWRSEKRAFKKPLISSTLSNPLSAYLTRIQARSLGLYVEIMAMDSVGLNVGQSSITTDYWQGDELKFHRTYLNVKDSIFIDEPIYDAEYNIWRTQVSLPVNDKLGKRIGAITFELNLTELERRAAAS
jgi:hypothetical protein